MQDIIFRPEIGGLTYLPLRLGERKCENFEEVNSVSGMSDSMTSELVKLKEDIALVKSANTHLQMEVESVRGAQASSREALASVQDALASVREEGREFKAGRPEIRVKRQLANQVVQWTTS